MIMTIILSFCLSPPDILDRCYFGALFRSDPLPGSRNFRGIYAGYVLFPVGLSSLAGLVIYSRDRSFLSASEALLVLHLWSYHYWYCSGLFFPTVFLFLSLDLGICWSFPGLFFYSAVSWDCHKIIHTCFFSTTVLSGMLCARCLSVCILKSQRILTSSFCRTLSTLCSHQLSAVGSVTVTAP